jgi:hypothetical protein
MTGQPDRYSSTRLPAACEAAVSLGHEPSSSMLYRRRPATSTATLASEISMTGASGGV